MAKAIIFKSELEFIARCVVDYQDIETGGDLFGFWTHSGYPSIQYVIGPGPKSNRNTTAFYQDKEYLIEMGRRLRKHYGLQHIGEWHSHHKLSLSQPSGGDKSTVKNAIQRYGLNYFFLTICNIQRKDININGFYFTAQNDDFEQAGWVILDGESPVRKEFDYANKSFLYHPREKRVIYSALPLTTLEETVIPIKEESPMFPEGSWMNTESGKEQLKSITSRLKKQFDDVKIFQTDDKKIKLDIHLGDKKFNVIFPHNFPKARPEINFPEVKSRSSMEHFIEVLNQRLIWDETNYRESYISNYIKALYSIDEIS